MLGLFGVIEIKCTKLNQSRNFTEYAEKDIHMARSHNQGAQKTLFTSL